MFGWFRPRCPLDVREKTWVELRMHWLVERFGAASIQSLDGTQLITPFLANAESLPVPLPDWRPDSHHMDFLDEENGAGEAGRE